MEVTFLTFDWLLAQILVSAYIELRRIGNLWVLMAGTGR